MATPLYLLDTNILVHFVRGDATWAKVRSHYNLFAIDPKPLISVVTHGELRSLAQQWHWQQAKTTQMEYALGYFKTVNIDDLRIIQAYAAIDSHFRQHGQKFGKNDLWIAATAAAAGARLLTTDHDFDALDPQFVSRDWVDPSLP